MLNMPRRMKGGRYMPAGEKLYCHFSRFSDPFTGRKVTRLTDPEYVSHHMYFYNRMTTADGNRILICMQREEGRQLYLLDLKDGMALQLTEGTEPDDYSGQIEAGDKAVFYVQAGAFWRQDIASGERQKLYSPPEGWRMGAPCPSSDFRYFAFTEDETDTFPAPKPGVFWNSFEQNCLAKPHCRIRYLDSRTGQVFTVYDTRCWLSHAQINPVRNDLIMFAHEGPYNRIDARLWLIEVDTEQGRERPCGKNLRRCRPQPDDLILTHEFWFPDGRHLGYVRREMSGNKQESICVMDPETLVEEKFMDCSPYAHFICDKKQRYFVGDAQTSDLPIHLLNQEEMQIKQKERASKLMAGEKPDPGNDFIYLVDARKRTESRLVWHGTSWMAVYGNPQDSHPHPCFSEDESKVFYTSDLFGRPAVFMAELEQ